MKLAFIAMVLAACAGSDPHEETSCDGKWHVGSDAVTTCERACLEPATSDMSGGPCTASNPSTPNPYGCVYTGQYSDGKGCCVPGRTGSDVVRFYECN